MLRIPVFQRWNQNKQQLVCDDRRRSVSDFGSAVHCGHLEFLFSTFKIPKQKETRELSYFSLACANVSVELSYFSFSFFFFHIFLWRVQMFM